MLKYSLKIKCSANFLIQVAYYALTVKYVSVYNIYCLIKFLF